MSKAPPDAADLDRISDEDLLLRYRNDGDPDDFAALLRRYERELYRYLVRYLNDPSLADDVFQNTFLQVHTKRALYEEGRPVRPWLYAIATHQAVDALRKARRRPTISLDRGAPSGASDSDPSALVELLLSDAPGPLSTLETRERQELVKACVAKLPETLRQTLILAYYQDLKYREIADTLGIPVGTVKSRLHAAIGKLGDLIAAASPDPERVAAK